MSTCLRLFFFIQVRESHSFYVYIFRVIVKRFFFILCTCSYLIQIIFKQIYLTHSWNPNSYYFGSEWIGSNGNEEVHLQDFQNWNLTIRCILESYPGHPLFFGGEGFLLLFRGYCEHIQGWYNFKTIVKHYISDEHTIIFHKFETSGFFLDTPHIFMSRQLHIKKGEGWVSLLVIIQNFLNWMSQHCHYN